MTVTTLALNCTYKHRISGRDYPLVSTWDSINDFVAWRNFFYITFIVLSSQFSIYFVSKCRILLIRLICLVFFVKMVLSIHGFCSVRTIFPCSHRVQDPVPTPMWCGHRSNYQIISNFCFSIFCYLNLFIIRRFLYSSLRTYFPLSILGSLCMLKIISTILKKVFWIIKGEITLVCLPVKPSHVLVLSLALTNPFVHSSIFVLIFRKEQPNLSFCKFFILIS